MICNIVRIWNTDILQSEVMEKVRHFIEMGLEHSLGEEDVESILKTIKANGGQLWIAYGDNLVQGVFTTQIIDYPRVASLRIITLAGDHFDEWIKEAYESLMSFARANKVNRMDLVGRRGWIRKLEPFGFVEAYTVCVKEIAL